MIQLQENTCTNERTDRRKDRKADGRVDRPYLIGPCRLPLGVQKVVQTNSAGLACASVKINQVIIMCVITFKACVRYFLSIFYFFTK